MEDACKKEELGESASSFIHPLMAMLCAPNLGDEWWVYMNRATVLGKDERYEC